MMETGWIFPGLKREARSESKRSILTVPIEPIWLTLRTKRLLRIICNMEPAPINPALKRRVQKALQTNLNDPNTLLALRNLYVHLLGALTHSILFSFHLFYTLVYTNCMNYLTESLYLRFLAINSLDQLFILKTHNLLDGIYVINWKTSH